MVDQKNKKKTLTISTNISKKIDLSSLTSDGKKTFSIEKKKPFKPLRDGNKSSSNAGLSSRPTGNKKNFARKFVEQQATKAFIKKDDKTPTKSKLS